MIKGILALFTALLNDTGIQLFGKFYKRKSSDLFHAFPLNYGADEHPHIHKG